MGRVKSAKPLTEFGQRVELAIEAEHRTQTNVEAALMRAPDWGSTSKGYLGRIMRGDRGATSLDPKKVKALARELHVEFEWLFIGEGPIRRGGRAETPAEVAIIAARSMLIREDAIQTTWNENREHEHDWTPSEWIEAILAKWKVFEGAPRPEVVHAFHDGVRGKKRKLKRLREKKEKEGENDGNDGLVPKRHAAAR